MPPNNLYKIAIIGPPDTVSGFKALGVEAFDAHNSKEALEQLRHIKQITMDVQSAAPYAIVCIIEDLLADVDQAEYAKAVSGALPAVVMLPGQNGSKGVAINRLRRLAEQAVGSTII